MNKVHCRVMNVWTDRQIDRQTDGIHILHVYVGLDQACPNYRMHAKKSSCQNLSFSLLQLDRTASYVCAHINIVTVYTHVGI